MSDVITVVEEAEAWLQSFEAFVAGHPELAAAPPTAGAGWVGVTAALAYLLGSIPTTPTNQNIRNATEALQGALETLKQPNITLAQARNAEAVVRFQTKTLVFLAKAEGLTIPPLGVEAGASLGLETMPSPGAVNQAQGAQLANAVARVAVWQRAHHAQVHGNLVEAQGRANAAAAALGLATATQGAATVDAIRAVVDVILPRAVSELTTTIRELRQAQQAANAELERALERTADRLVTRIGDLTRWLVTTALPDLEEQIKAERAARKDADHELRRGIATEADVRADADLGLQTAVAPLVAWASSFGVHTTEKVRRLENPLDQLLNADWSLVLGFASFPALVALIGKLLPHVAGATPAVLGSLEGAASRALGEL